MFPMFLFISKTFIHIANWILVQKVIEFVYYFTYFSFSFHN